MRSDADSLRRPLARFNALTFVIIFALLVGVALWASTVFLVVKGGPTPGARMSLLREYLPGYSVTLGGACVGFLWALVLCPLVSYPPAYIYYRGVLRQVTQANDGASDSALLQQTARIHVPTFAASFGAFAGGLLFLATLWLVVKHEPGEALGPHLALLRNYLPGYEVSLAGALLGLVYMFLIGGVAFTLVGWIYNALVGTKPSGRTAP